jgi:hypothetical protein
MNMLEAFKVYDVNSPKVRVGNQHDGGYILNKIITDNTCRLVSIGIGGEDSFEMQWIENYPNCIVEMYDGTYPCNNVCNKYPDKINDTIFYHQYNVGNNPGNIKLFNILNNKTPTLLKVDIEGGEYEIFDNIFLQDNIVGFLLEIHDLHITDHLKKINELITKNFRDMILFHIHGNSWGGTFELNLLDHRPNNKSAIISDFPHVMELSFINKNIVNNFSLDKSNFPIAGIDMSNKLDVEDIDLYWINKI